MQATVGVTDVKRAKDTRLGINAFVSDYEMMHYGDRARDYMHHVARDLQYRLGEALVDTLWRVGGVATVKLSAHDAPSYEQRGRDISLEADVRPADHIYHRLSIPHFDHFDVFPADWYCQYCGMLNNGLKHPRRCPECGASK
jgi:hypothetical protein